MHPVLLHWPTITSYGVMMLVGLAGGWWLARRQAKRAGLDPSHIDLMSPLVVLAGLVGSIAMHVFGEGGDASGHGRALLGGLLAAVATGIVYAVGTRVRLGTLGDIVAAPMAFGIAAGRVGCFLAGCCWGKTCGPFPLAVTFPRDSFAFHHHVSIGWLDPNATASLAVHPTQLYEAAGAALIGVILLLLWDRRHVSGELFLTFALAYAALRFPLEFLRADNAVLASGLTVSQWLCLAVAGVCAATWAVRRKMAPAWARDDGVSSAPS